MASEGSSVLEDAKWCDGGGRAVVERNRKKFDLWAQLIQQNIRKCSNLTASEALARAGIEDLKDVLDIMATSAPPQMSAKFEMTPERFVDWLLSEAEYCCHTLLMTKGNVLVHSCNVLIMGYLWAPPGHASLLETEKPSESANRRLKMALEAMQHILECPTVQFDFSWPARWNRILVMASGSASNKLISAKLGIVKEDAPFSYGKLERKPFFDVMMDKAGRQDLYLYGYVDAMHRLLKNMTGLRWNLDVFCDAPCALDEVLSIVDNLPAARKITEQGIPQLFFKLFRKAFGNLTFADKRRVMMYVYEKYGADLWHLSDEQFEAGLASLMVKMLTQKESITNLAAEFCWFFMISLKYTWWRLLWTASRFPTIISVVVNVLRHLPEVTNLRSRDDGPRVILISLQRALTDSQTAGEVSERNMIRIACALTSDLMRKFCGCRVVKLSIVSKAEGVSTLVLPALQSNPRLAMKLLLSLLVSGTEFDIKWSGEMPKEGDENWNADGVNVAKLLSMIVDVITNSKKREDIKLGFDLLHLLFTVWKDCEYLEFSSRMVEEWLVRRLEKAPWMVRCFVFRHLRYLVWVQEPLPTCLVRMFDLADYGFSAIDCGDRSQDDCFNIRCAFSGLLQLAQVSIDMAREIVHLAQFDRVVAKMKSDELTEPLAQALACVLSETEAAQDWRNCVELLSLFFDRMWVEKDAGLKEAFWLESMSVGARMVSPAVKLCEAMTLIVTSDAQTSVSAQLRGFLGTAGVLRDIVQERVHTMDNPLAKLFAVTFLHLNVGHLATTKEYAPADTDLFTATMRALESEKVKAEMDLSAASESLGMGH